MTTKSKVMSSFIKSIIDRARNGEELTLANVSDSEPMVMANPEGVISVDVDSDSDVVILHDGESVEGEVVFKISQDVKLSIVSVLLCSSKLKVNIEAHKNSSCNITSFDLAGADSRYNIELLDCGADAELNILQLTTGEDKSKSDAVIRHMSSDCTSRSLAKCVAAGESTAEFYGLVYVAKDAQRTISEQNSRNIQLSEEAHITSQPQLEIYADDVKCTHGATVGQMNDEAIFYMMQRGLSRELAKKLHLEGFVADIVNRCSITSLTDELKAIVEDRLHQI